MRKILIIIIASILMTGIYTYAYAATPQVIEAEGVFVMGDNDTKTQAKNFALQDAKRLALEKAGTYLKSSTQVVDGQVTKDEIVTIASGVIKLEKIIMEEAVLNSGVMSLKINAQFIIDSDDLQKKIEDLKKSENRQAEIQKMAALQEKYDNLLTENNQLKTQLAHTDDENAKKQLLIRTKEIDKQLREQLTKTNDESVKEQLSDTLSKIDNQLTSTQFYESGTSYTEKGQHDLAIVDFSKAVQANPQYVEAYISRGMSYAQKGQYDSAIADASKVIQLAPQNWYGYNNRGYAYIKKGQIDLAIADFNKMLRLFPDFYRGYVGLGYCYLNQGEYDLAIANYTKASNKYYRGEGIYINRGNCYSQKGQYDLAIVDYIRAIELNEDAYLAYYNRGLVYEKLKKYDLAIVDYTKSIQLNSQFTTAYERLREVYTLKSKN